MLSVWPSCDLRACFLFLLRKVARLSRSSAARRARLQRCHTRCELPAACADRTGRRFPSLVRAHEDARLAAASLYSLATEQAAAGHGGGATGPRGAVWQESALTLRRALLQLTRAGLITVHNGLLQIFKGSVDGYVWKCYWHCQHLSKPWRAAAKPIRTLVGKAGNVLAMTCVVLAMT